MAGSIKLGLAALLAAATLVSSLTQPHPLDRRQATCPKKYTSKLGLAYDVHCDQNQSGWDLLDAAGNIITTQNSTIEECMEQCSVTIPLCFGTVFTQSTGTCWYKNETFTYQPSVIINDVNTILAVPVSGALDSLDTDCPFKNNSIHTSASGENFTIHCGLDIVNGGYAPTNAPIFGAPWRADNLTDCMEQCSKATPWCKAVAFNPGLGNGYANCYPKNSVPGLVPGGSPDGPNDKAFIRHSAVAQDPPLIADPCQNTGQSILSTGGTSYRMSCNEDRGGNDFKQSFELSLQSCLDKCDDEKRSDCVGVVFDTEMVAGWENCYLKNSTGIANDGRNGFVFAQRGDKASGGGGSSKSKAWIAGPVIGGVVLIAIAVALWRYFQIRRKKASYYPVNGAAAAEAKPGGYENNAAQYPNGYEQQNMYGWQQQQQEQPRQPWDGAKQWDTNQAADPSYEMEAQHVTSEMPGSQTQPTELPSSPVRRPDAAVHSLGVNYPHSVQATPTEYSRR